VFVRCPGDVRPGRPRASRAATATARRRAGGRQRRRRRRPARRTGGVRMISELTGGIWSCEQDDGPRIVREVVIAGDQAVLVVDTGLPGSGRDELLPLVERLGERELIVLITHPDSDHLGGTAELLAAKPGARVLAGALDVPLVGNPERIVRDRYARFAVHDDVPFGEAAAERAIDRAGPSFTGTEVVVPTPGHSPGHVSAWVPDADLLVAADAIMGNGIPTRDGGLMIAPMYGPPEA